MGLVDSEIDLQGSHLDTTTIDLMWANRSYLSGWCPLPSRTASVASSVISSVNVASNSSNCVKTLGMSRKTSLQADYARVFQLCEGGTRAMSVVCRQRENRMCVQRIVFVRAAIIVKRSNTFLLSKINCSARKVIVGHIPLTCLSWWDCYERGFSHVCPGGLL